jgi:hypothetical protein
MLAVAAVLIGVTYASMHFVWLPDVFSKRIHVLADTTYPGGDRLIVTQQWNSVDFYSTFLIFEKAGGKRMTFVVDGDDNKEWRCDLLAGTSNSQVHVLFGKEEDGVFDMETGIFRNHTGMETGPVDP